MLRDRGVNRLSIGVQSFADRDLQILGRTHRSDKSLQALEDAHEAGFGNISLDLMYGLPGQRVESWRKNLEQAVALRPQHLSLYQLSIEKGTGFFEQYHAGSLQLPDDQEILAMEKLSRDYLASRGIEQYEISSYARPGYECRHNIGYWYNEEFTGCGAGAAGFSDRRRYTMISDPLQYCLAIECGEDGVEEEEILDLEASFRETVVMGLRLLKGVERKKLFDRFALRLEDQYGAVLTELVEKGLLEKSETHIRLTSRGRCFANQVMAELV
jgi:oxygen-independent coproporphyrinogen-3 oxidase